MTRDAELRARDFVSLVSGGIQAETEVGVAQRLLLQAQTALSSYADPEWAQSEGWPAFADRLLELARAAAAGSDHQLAFVNALCTSVLSTRHVVVLADLLDHDPAELGLAGLIDRHRSALADRHGAGRRRRRSTPTARQTPFIDAEVQRDPTAAGKRIGAQAVGGATAGGGQGIGVDRRSPKTTRWPTSPRGRSSPVSSSPARPSCSSRSARATSRRYRACGSAGPARSRRRWWSACTRRGTSATTASPPPTRSSPIRSCPPHCAGWCSRAAPESSGRCARVSSTAER